MNTKIPAAPGELIPRGRMIRGLAMFLAFSVAGLAVLYLYGDESDTRQAVMSLRGGFFVLAVLSAVADVLIGAVRYQIFLRRIRPGTPLMLSIRADLAGRFLGAVTPSQTGGGPAQVFILSRGGIPVPDVLSFLLVNFLSTLTFFLVAGSSTAWVLRERFPEGTIHTLVQYGFVAFAGCVLTMLVGLFRPDWIAASMAWSARRFEGRTGSTARLAYRCCHTLAGSLDHYRAACTRLVRENPVLPLLSFVLTWLLYLNKFTLAWLLLRSLGASSDYITTLAVQALLHFILFVAPSPGGSGIAEISTGALMAVVMPGHLLAAFTLAFRFLLLYLPAGVGALVLLRELRPPHGRAPSNAVAGRAVPPATVSAKLVVALTAGLLWIPAQAGAQHSGTRDACGAAVPSTACVQVEALVVQGLRAADEDSASAAFERAVEHARALVGAAPEDPQAHYLLSVALGCQLEHQGMRRKLELAREVRTEAERALELAPAHAGAHHVLGRLNGAAMRLNPFSRFLARRIFGASALKGVSWDAAERHFREAWRSDPASPRHAMELGALYLDTGRPEMARSVLLAATALTPTETADSLASTRARQLLAQIPEE